MEANEVLKLIDAGFTADEIRNMNSDQNNSNQNPDQNNEPPTGSNSEPKDEQNTEPKNEPKNEPNNEPKNDSNNTESERIKELETENSNLKRLLQTENIKRNSFNDKPKETTAEDALLSLLRY